MTILRRVCLFLSVIIYTLAIAFVITSLTTKYWYSIKPIDIDKSVNSTYIHAGLFFGEKKFDYKFESLKESFSGNFIIY